MSKDEPYTDAAAVERAISDKSRRAYSKEPSLSVQKRIELEYYNRFLSRVFNGEGNKYWVLKGGASLLARCNSARSTRDIDLFATESSIKAAIDRLKAAAKTDLGDFFTFIPNETIKVLDDVPYAEGATVKCDVLIGGVKKHSLSIDVVASPDFDSNVEKVYPKTKLEMPRLKSNPYVLYPVVNHIADKVCATLEKYGDQKKDSTREKDLVDLVVIAESETVQGKEL